MPLLVLWTTVPPRSPPTVLLQKRRPAFLQRALAWSSILACPRHRSRHVYYRLLVGTRARQIAASIAALGAVVKKIMSYLIPAQATIMGGPSKQVRMITILMERRRRTVSVRMSWMSSSSLLRPIQCLGSILILH